MPVCGLPAAAVELAACRFPAYSACTRHTRQASRTIHQTHMLVVLKSPLSLRSSLHLGELAPALGQDNIVEQLRCTILLIRALQVTGHWPCSRTAWDFPYLESSFCNAITEQCQGGLPKYQVLPCAASCQTEQRLSREHLRRDACRGSHSKVRDDRLKDVV